MGTKTVIHRFSDVSGATLDSSKKPTLFSVDDKGYEIDLTDAEFSEFQEVLERCVSAAHQLSGKRSAGRPRPAKPDLAKIREWAEANGYSVAPRGRIAQNVVDAYDKATAIA
ncbi:Lsr2 family protein [Arthrobacter sp. efr-133-TYG-118]|uniref:histone-like nucleoid-structuring protein Lsr2 n=1 Tax=Arthrobacter sp. efr-133-TYG-118 TaxID=3040279 RepID=UPI00254C8C7E|nr:Lsr2 family protein [Arthrobacter sp. efr-133-TYG-118]